ncbi:uncharacterized protein LOC119729167 [Patiria miniata]|uniref:Uncharacterized protein n=1 Tax=Patiria miniata TaxID=46514 RepID=A0A914A1V4_PATMI|nr:uncharacterized protein LOC119729167 [Patiria miniata]
MAMIAQLVLLSLSVQSLLATNGTLSPAVSASMSTPTTVTGVMGSAEPIEPSTVSNVNTEAPATSNHTNPIMSTPVSTASTLSPAATGSTAAAPGATATEPGSTTALVPSGSTVSLTAPPSQMPTESGTTTPAGGGTPTEMSRTAGMTSSMTQAVTSEPTSGLMTTLATIMKTTKGGSGSEGVSLAVYIAAGVVSGLVVLVIIFAIGVWCLRSRKSQDGRGTRNPFGPDEMDKLDPKARMSMHRPASASVNADDDLAFVTFSTGPGTASAEYHVGGIENPTYALSNVSDGEEPTAGEGGQDQNGAATMPSPARLSIAEPTEGAAEGESEGGKGRNIRPQSGVSYTSNDIDGALETLEIGTV